MSSFPRVDPDLDILLKMLTVQIWSCIWKIASVHYLSGVGDFMQSMSSFLIFLVQITLMP